MTVNPNFFDFSTAGPQRELIPEGTVALLEMAIQPGGHGPDGWLRQASTDKGVSMNVLCQYTAVSGDHAGKKFSVAHTVDGQGPNFADAVDISRKHFRAVVECARGIRSDDKTPEADQLRKTAGWADLQRLRFWARIGALPPRDSYAAKNIIRLVITPDQPGWAKPERIDRSGLAPNPAVTPTQPTQPTQPAQPAAGQVARPDWAKRD